MSVRLQFVFEKKERKRIETLGVRWCDEKRKQRQRLKSNWSGKSFASLDGFWATRHKNNKLDLPEISWPYTRVRAAREAAYGVHKLDSKTTGFFSPPPNNNGTRRSYLYVYVIDVCTHVHTDH